MEQLWKVVLAAMGACKPPHQLHAGYICYWSTQESEEVEGPRGKVCKQGSGLTCWRDFLYLDELGEKICERWTTTQGWNCVQNVQQAEA